MWPVYVVNEEQSKRGCGGNMTQSGEQLTEDTCQRGNRERMLSSKLAVITYQ